MCVLLLPLTARSPACSPCFLWPEQANLGVRLKCLDPTPDAPASWAAKTVEGHFRDAVAIQRFLDEVRGTHPPARAHNVHRFG